MSIAPGLRPAGLHVYDGHIHDSDVAKRRAACDAAFAPVHKLTSDLHAQGLEVPEIIAGGRPSFSIHAARERVTLSPGTALLWDAGYAHGCSELPFEMAAAVLTRVVSRPAPDCVTLDIGTKAIASEMSPPRAVFPQIPDAQLLAHNEEHMVLRTKAPLRLGAAVFACPWHICPTVNLHDEAMIVRDGRVEGAWRIAARARRLSA